MDERREKRICLVVIVAAKGEWRREERNEVK